MPCQQPPDTESEPESEHYEPEHPEPEPIPEHRIKPDPDADTENITAAEESAEEIRNTAGETNTTRPACISAKNVGFNKAKSLYGETTVLYDDMNKNYGNVIVR